MVRGSVDELAALGTHGDGRNDGRIQVEECMLQGNRGNIPLKPFCYWHKIGAV